MKTEQISVFGGHGFVLGEYTKAYNNISYIQEKNNYVPEYGKILYGISTTTNYNVLDDPYLDINVNLLTLMRVLENSRKKFGNKFEFNFISSWFVYGDTFLPASEESDCHPKGFYSVTKLAAEQLLQSYCNTYDIRYRILRLANVLGIADKKVSMQKNYTQFLIKQLLMDAPVSIYYDGRFYRDYIDSRDCAKAIHLAINYGKLNSIYNISNGVAVSFKSILDFLIEKTGTKSIVSFTNENKFHSTVQVKSMYMNNLKLKNLGYKPEHYLYDTLQEIINEYRKKEDIPVN